MNRKLGGKDDQLMGKKIMKDMSAVSKSEKEKQYLVWPYQIPDKF